MSKVVGRVWVRTPGLSAGESSPACVIYADPGGLLLHPGSQGEEQATSAAPFRRPREALGSGPPALQEGQKGGKVSFL